MPSLATLPHHHSFPTRRSSDLLLSSLRRAYLSWLRRGSWLAVASAHATTFGVFLNLHSTRRLLIIPCTILWLLCYLGRLEIFGTRSEEHTSELQSRGHLVCRLLPPSLTITLSLHDALPICFSAASDAPTSVGCDAAAGLPLLARTRRRLESFSISIPLAGCSSSRARCCGFSATWGAWKSSGRDRKSTRLNSSHVAISYAVSCHPPSPSLFPYTTLFRSASQQPPTRLPQLAATRQLACRC